MSPSLPGNRLSAKTRTLLRGLRHCVHFPLWCTRWGLKLVVLVYFLLAITFLLLRYVGAPQIAAHRAEIVEALGAQLGLKVEIAQLDAHWDGLRPTLAMRGMRLIDAGQREVLLLPRVDAELGWSTLWRRELTLHSLSIAGADLAIQRNIDGQLFIAGMPITSTASNEAGFAKFLLSQHRIEINDSRLRWEDAQRAAPLLHLDQLALRLDNDGERHRFALRAQPMAQLTAPLDIRGDLRGNDPGALSDWRGALYLDLQGADLAVWQQWLDYPVELPKGRGAVRAWLNFEGAKIAALTADVALASLQLRVQPDLPMLDLAALQGRLLLSGREGERYVAGERITLTTADGQKSGPSHFALRSNSAQAAITGKPATPARGELTARALDMRVLAQLASHLPLPAPWQTRLAEVQPRGTLERLEASWESGPDAATQTFARYELKAKANSLAMNAVGHVPGIEGLNIELQGSEKGGQFQVEVSKGAISLPAVFRESHVALGSLRSRGQWSMEGSAAAPLLRVTLQEGILKNADADAVFSGNWLGTPGTAGRIDLVLNASRALPAAVWRYIPARLPKSLPDWLEHGLQGGVARDVVLRLRGPLAHFPFLDGDGEFHVSGRFSGTRLDYAPGSWPALDDVQGELLFEGKRMLITGRSARYRDVMLRDVTAEIPDLMEVGKQNLTVRGRAKGSTQTFLGVVSGSNLPLRIRRFAQDVRADGIGELSLKLDMPLHAIRDTRVQGEYQLEGNTLRLLPRLPDFSKASARLQFTEQGITLPTASADFLGSQLTATGSTDSDGSLRFAIRGQLNSARLTPLLDSPLWHHLGGEAAASANLRISSADAELRVESSLQGIASDLPAPFGKSAANPQPALFVWRQPASTNAGATSEQHWQLRIGDVLDAQWQQQCSSEACEFARGAVGIGEAPVMPASGMRVAARFNQLDLDAWRPILLGASRGAAAGDSILSSASLHAQTLLLGGHVFRDQQARVTQDKERWLLRLEGQDAAGELSWDAEGQGLLRARLSRLALNPPDKKETAAARSAPAATPVSGAHEQLPALDIKADNFLLKDRALGALELQAHNQADVWLLDRINIWSADGDIAASGQYRALRAGSETRLDFKLAASNLGKMMGRFGYADAIAGGQATLNGKLSWNAAPTTLDYASLSGSMEVAAKSGQFVKLDPGAGRLLGVLSLQAIPRRVTLDFRDVFSEGFAFDNISGHVDIVQGVMRTQDFTIRGPAAKVAMRGSTDIVREQHNLQVNVQPTLSESVALGAAAVGVGVVNPAVGLATYLAQKLLSDPVERLFAYDYSIGGSWADPVVAKLGSPLTQSGPRKENPP